MAYMMHCFNLVSIIFCQAGNELPSELLQILLRMAPTDDEEFKLRVYNGDVSLLGPAEQFLKVLVDIPFAFKRMDALSFMASFSEDTSTLKDAFESLEASLYIQHFAFFLI